MYIMVQKGTKAPPPEAKIIISKDVITVESGRKLELPEVVAVGLRMWAWAEKQGEGHLEQSSSPETPLLCVQEKDWGYSRGFPDPRASWDGLH